jgi:uncharacterized protein YacL
MQMNNLGLFFVRAVFVAVAVGLGVALINSTVLPKEPWAPWAAIGGMTALALGLIRMDIAVGRKELQTVTAIYFGLIVGVFLTYIVRLALLPIFPDLGDAKLTPAAVAHQQLGQFVILMVGMILCYLCVSILMQTKDDFRFIIPYVEFSPDLKGRKPLVLDTSVIIDGRIADLLDTKTLDNQLIIPSFVVAELQNIADGNDRLKRTRGRRGLDILNRIRENKQLEVDISEHELPEFEGQPVDMRLVLLAKHLGGKLVTNDYNLNKVAALHHVPVINLNDIANALKPVFIVGENIEVRIIKAGEGAGQGVGYLDDGTMIVVEGGRDHLNETVRVTVTSMLQKSAGRMVFAKYESSVAA